MAEQFTNLFSVFSDELAVRWLMTLLHFLWQGVVIGAVFAIAVRVQRNASARWRYGVSSVAFLCLPVCVVITFGIVEVPVSLRSDSDEAQVNVATSGSSSGVLQETPKPAAASLAAESAVDGAISVVTQSGDGTGTDGAGVVVTATDQTDDHNGAVLNSGSSSSAWPARVSHAAPWIAAVWAVGVACFLLRLGTGLWSGRRLRAATEPVTDENLLRLIAEQAERVRLKCVPVVACCERIVIPTVVGVLRPVILLPLPLITGLNSEDLAAVIRHELAHIRRYDLWMNLFQRVIESLLFFHPVVWLISRRVSAERELCCDELVVSSGCEPLDYAGALLRTAELCSSLRQPAALALAATGDRPSQLEQRIERLMRRGSEPRLQLHRGGMAGLLLILATLVVVPGVARAWAQEVGAAGSPDSEEKSLPVEPSTEPAASESAASESAATESAATESAATESAATEPAETSTADSVPAEIYLPDQPTMQLSVNGNTTAVRYGAAGNELVAVSYQAGVTTVRRWKVANGELVSEVRLDIDEPVDSRRLNTVRISSDCQRVLASMGGSVGIWDATTGQLVRELEIPRVGEEGWERDKAKHLACTPDFSVVAAVLGTDYTRTTVFYDAYAILWNVVDGSQQIVRRQHANEFHAIALSENGRLLAATNQGRASVWAADTGELVYETTIKRSAWSSSEFEVYDVIGSLQFSPDSRWLAVGTTLGVKLVEADSGELVRRIADPYRYSNGHPGLVFSADSRMLARLGTSRGKSAVPIWSTETGERLWQLPTRSDDGVFSGDGQQFVVGSSHRDQDLAVWALSDTEPEQASAGDDRISWGPVGENGVQVGLRFDRANRQVERGEQVAPRFFFRCQADETVEVSLPRLMTRGYYKQLIAVDGNGQAFNQEQDDRPLTPVGWLAMRLSDDGPVEIRGLPIQLGGKKQSGSESLIRVGPGQETRIHFVVPNFADRESKPLRTGGCDLGGNGHGCRRTGFCF